MSTHDEQASLRQMNEAERVEWFNRNYRVLHSIGLLTIKVNGCLVAAGYECEAVEMLDRFLAAIDGPDLVRPNMWQG